MAMRMMLAFVFFVCLVSFILGIKIDPALRNIIDNSIILPRSASNKYYHQVLITFIGDEDIERYMEKLQISIPIQGVDLFSILKEANEQSIQLLEKKLSDISSDWSSMQKYSVSNSWLIKGDSKVIEFLFSQENIIAELHLDRPFKISGVHLDEKYPSKIENDIYLTEFESKVTSTYELDSVNGNSSTNDNPEAFNVKINRNSDLIAEWNIHYVGATNIWNTTTGNNMIYASADTGVFWTHPVLESRYIAKLWNYNSSFIKHDYAWWDGVRTTLKEIYNENDAILPGNKNVASKECPMSSREPCDDIGHGTHTTSTAVGTSGFGVAPGAYWMACRNMYKGFGSTSTYLNCLEFFLAPTDLEGLNPDPSKRPHVIGNSYGCPHETEGCATWAFHKAIKALRAAGVLMVVSAGNTGPSCSSLTAPPSYEPDVLTVGATSFLSDEIAIFSSRGPCSDATMAANNARFMRVKPEIVAPGINIRGAHISSTFVSLSGTSMAAPHIAGAILLISSACPHLLRDINRLEELVMRTARKCLIKNPSMLCGKETLQSYPNFVYGYGALQVDFSIRTCLDEASNIS